MVHAVERRLGLGSLPVIAHHLVPSGRRRSRAGPFAVSRLVPEPKPGAATGAHENRARLPRQLGAVRHRVASRHPRHLALAVRLGPGDHAPGELVALVEHVAEARRALDVGGVPGELGEAKHVVGGLGGGAGGPWALAWGWLRWSEDM